jgi:hypothetical protein
MDAELEQALRKGYWTRDEGGEVFDYVSIDDGVKAANLIAHLEAEVERLREENEEARHSGAKAFRDMMISSTKAILHPHIDGVWAVFNCDDS